MADQLNTFQHTWSADGDTDNVTIPGGMPDATYCLSVMLNTIPAGGSGAVFKAPDATRSPTGFVLQASGTIKQNTVLDIIVRDRS